jgi:hypothetical protein
VSIGHCSAPHLLVTIQITHGSRLYLKLKGLATKISQFIAAYFRPKTLAAFCSAHETLIASNSRPVFGSSRSRMEQLQLVNHEKLGEDLAGIASQL